MKIKIVKKSELDDQGVIDLSKVVALHNNPVEGLEVYSQIHEQPARFSGDLYDFYISKSHNTKVTIPDILNAFYRTGED